MSSTNKTTNYDLSQFIGSDKPAWLVDYNGDMAAIDTQMKANADAASAAQTTANTADGKADTNAGAISTLDNQINGAAGLAADVVAVQGSVNTINSLIGNGEPTTTDKTLIGAINELDGDITDVAQSVADVKTIFNATDIMPVTLVEVSADGVKTLAELLAELHTAVNTYLSGLEDGQKVLTGGLVNPTVYAEIVEILSNTHGLGTRNWSFFGPKGTGVALNQVRIAASNCHHYEIAVADDGTVTFTDKTSDVPTSGTKIQFQGIRNF